MSDKPKGVHQYNLAELQAYLTDRGVQFAPDAKHADLKKIALEIKKKEDDEARLAEIKEELTAKGVQFAPDATLEDLEKILADSNDDSNNTSAEDENKVPEGYVRIRNEKNRVINGLKPWRIALVKEENVAFYVAHGCSVYTGAPTEVEIEEATKKDDKSIPPHERTK